MPRRPPGTPRARLRLKWTDRALIATLTLLLPVRRRLGLLVTPTTILRWHRQLLTRRWTSAAGRPGRPAVPAGLRALVLRLATENGHRPPHTGSGCVPALNSSRTADSTPAARPPPR